MSHTVFEFGWGNYIAIPNEKVSAMLKLLEEAMYVDSMYINDKLTWYIINKQRQLSMQCVNRFIPGHQAKVLRDQHEAAKEQTNGA